MEINKSKHVVQSLTQMLECSKAKPIMVGAALSVSCHGTGNVKLLNCGDFQPLALRCQIKSSLFPKLFVALKIYVLLFLFLSLPCLYFYSTISISFLLSLFVSPFPSLPFPLFPYFSTLPSLPFFLSVWYLDEHFSYKERTQI